MPPRHAAFSDLDGHERQWRPFRPRPTDHNVIGWRGFLRRYLGRCVLFVLGACGLVSAHAQSMAPANTSPIDAFHQPCVAVRALPRAVLRLTPDGETLRPATQPSADTDRTRQPAKHYVDLDNLCATPPAFAPTRDIDSTSVWYVDAPSAYRHAVGHGADGLAS